MDFAAFIAKWKKVALTERSAAQQHFLDLCALLDHPTPAADDPTGDAFTFERGAAKLGGGDGWADVWKRGCFGWEYKGKHKDLDAAYTQLLRYREALENPPLLVVCDMERIVVHTNFTNTPKAVYTIPLAEMEHPRNVEILRAVFFQPEALRPGTTSAAITTDAAQRIAQIAMALRGRGLDAHEVAHFLDRIVFCFFAEDIGLLPNHIFTRLLETTRDTAARFAKLVGELFAAMAHGGDFGLDTIRHFNGNLFNGGPVLDLTIDEIDSLRRAALLDWSAVDASIFGTLFERGMDPAKRTQLGAHYTSRADIETLVAPVVMAPLRCEWAAVQAQVDALLPDGGKATPKARAKADALLHAFLTRLAGVTVLDPACGSGNFLFVTLQMLKDLELAVIHYAVHKGLSAYLPAVGPWQLYGIEINDYAHDLAQMTVWIGYLQWTHAHGYRIADTPVLRRMDNIVCKDAILDLADPDHPRTPDWPAVDFIVGNPPFLGDKLMRGELGDAYVETLRALYAGRIPGQSDLCCYWFEIARQQIADGKCRRAGLLATQGIRGGANREVLKRIKDTGDIFFAESDRPWVLDGANVHVSMVGFDDGSEVIRVADSIITQVIQPNLSSVSFNIASAITLKENRGIGFLGTTKKAPLDIDDDLARSMLYSPNPHRKPTSDVVIPYLNANDLTSHNRNYWIIDYPVEMSLSDAASYELPFRYVEEHVYPIRLDHREPIQSKYWWRLARPCPELKNEISKMSRFIVTPAVSKYRLFVWISAPANPDHALIVFARSDDYFFGVLHSRIHEVWSLKLGTRLETRPRYTPTTCFETFPFPRPTAAQETAIAAAARELDALRQGWLNPPEWTVEEMLTFPGSTDGPWARYVHDPDARGIGTVRYPRLVARDAHRAHLAARTLTNLYNARPAWLDLAHRALDAAVFAAYGWDPALSDDALLAALLDLNLARAAEEATG
jgi:type II restriction/modification system DNA methylase subunit YeeA